METLARSGLIFKIKFGDYTLLFKATFTPWKMVRHFAQNINFKQYDLFSSFGESLLETLIS